MKKLKVSADGYIAGSIIFWLVFIAMAIFSKILFTVLGLTSSKIFGNLSTSDFIGILFVVGLFIGLVIMMISASVLLASNKNASSANYKAEARWAVSVFALNLLFTLIFAAWFIVSVLMTDIGGKTILANKDLVVTAAFTLRISNIIDYLAIIGLVFAIIAFSLSIAISNRTGNVVKKIKEYEKVNIY